MLDWSTGAPTARYWVLWLLLRTMGEGDAYVATTTTNTTALFAQAFSHGSTPSLLLVSKENVVVDATINITGLPAPAPTTCTAQAVDETTRLSPPRSLPCTITGGALTLPPLLPYSTVVVTLA